MKPDFDAYFTNIYGPRWPALREALAREPERVERACFGGYARYVMDSASIRAVQALGVREGDRVLDLCAAPGGKALILAEARPSQLVANEFSSARRRRLEQVVRDHIPESERPRVKVTGFDGNRFGLKTPSEFDRVLLDAPCSSERHLIEQDKINEWTESRTKQLAKRQYSLLCAAVLAAKPDATIVYSTCSISPLENDGVVERLLERKGDQVQLDSDATGFEGLERTRVGFQIFPDQAGGQGPMYIARLKKSNMSLESDRKVESDDGGVQLRIPKQGLDVATHGEERGIDIG
ncbi:MAG: RsmB/NOP family class I SAM-dependent RNA methyltransferase [Bdellovibrionales bacterium]|nr:RsmB/NOP family class I SAM-dependent RNA methyltransferase [Bdellovibrionales bacterium]